MLDFFRIATKEGRKKEDPLEVYADFVVGRSKDLMVRGGAFYAIWDEEKGLWSTDEYDVVRLVDNELYKYAEELKADGIDCVVKPLRLFDTNRWNKFRQFMKNVSNNSHQLDRKVTFANTPVKKTDYASRRLPYDLAEGDISAWDELVSHLYEPEERAKFEWAIGAVICGAAQVIEKFLVFHGGPGTGKSTVMKVAEAIFGGDTSEGGYVASFDAQALTSNNGTFATAAFKDNPLLAIQQDGDLSGIQQNAKLNMIIAHERLDINEKYKSNYSSKVYAMLFLGTNLPVKITDAKSGLLRRLIDVNPTGRLFEPDHYYVLMDRIYNFEIGAIAYHCLQVYNQMGRDAYSSYKPVSMMFLTDPFANFIDSNFLVLKSKEAISLKQAYDLYKAYCAEARIPERQQLVQYKFREELKNYYDNFNPGRAMINGEDLRQFYTGFKEEIFKTQVVKKEAKQVIKTFALVMEETNSFLDRELANWPAQYAGSKGGPMLYWTDDEERMIRGVLRKPKPEEVVKTTLSDLDTTKLHYVKVPKNLIVIDFDLTDEKGNKSREKNLEAAAKFPKTYAEFSKSGAGVHLHYYYDGDVDMLARDYSDGIEIKVYNGNSALRRQLSQCNGQTIATLNSGALPLREKTVLSDKTIQNETHLRKLIERALRKEVHSGTKPSIDFIKHVLDEAYADKDLVYDVSNMKQRVVAFANNSSNRQLDCLQLVQQMRFKSDKTFEEIIQDVHPDDDRLAFFDVEVYPNLFVVCYKFAGSPTIVKMINPSAERVRGLYKLKLVGFNCRRYDNHILWAAGALEYTIEQLYKLSQAIINKQNVLFREAYNLSYADIYDYTVKKQGLKKWEIELGMHHMEMDIPWDQPVPPEKVDAVVEYCCNDVLATEGTHDANQADWIARRIMADLSGMTENDTNPAHAQRIIFGLERNPQRAFVYTDLAKEFPGYQFNQFAPKDKSTFMGEVVGEGGYVYAEPGYYKDVAVLDVASMHPHSIKWLNLFGHYTSKFVEIMDARLGIKHAMEAFKEGDIEAGRHHLDAVSGMMGGKLAPYLKGITDPGALKGISDALKLVINTVYGLTAATFENAFRDERNKDNIVAKRGALFMIKLKHEIQKRGFTVAHIKTDSVKIPYATPEIIQFVKDFGEEYGYTFEHETTYSKFCLVNDAVFIALDDKGRWKATGAQFQQPYVYKTMFTGEQVTLDDLCETKQVQKGAMYLDFDWDRPMGVQKDDPHFVGRTGLFLPVTENGAHLLVERDGKFNAVTGTKGTLWTEVEMFKKNPQYTEDMIDMSYYERMADEARSAIEQYVDYAEFVDGGKSGEFVRQMKRELVDA